MNSLKSVDSNLRISLGEKPDQTYQDKIVIIISQAPKSHYELVQSSLLSFAFLNVNATIFSQLVTVETLTKRVIHLFETINEIPAPDCPEMFDPSITLEGIQFQKINRLIFHDFDEEILQYFNNFYPSKDKFSYPVVEWAVNIIPVFLFDKVIQEEGKNLEQKIISLIIHHYDSNLLKTYLSKAWSLVSTWNKDINGKNGLIDRLRCDMCYPVRLSILE